MVIRDGGARSEGGLTPRTPPTTSLLSAETEKQKKRKKKVQVGEYAESGC